MAIANTQSTAVWRFDPDLRDADKGELRDVLAVSPDETWAVGNTVPVGRVGSAALVVRWTPDLSYAVPAGTGATSDVRLHALGLTREHVWAVGQISIDSTGGRPRIERYARLPEAVGVAIDGPEVEGDGALHGVVMVSETDGWAVGGSGPGRGAAFTKTLTARWDGNTWRTFPSPSPGATNQLNAVAARSADDVWAVGHTDSNALIMHWDGSAWTQVPVPDAEGRGGELLALALLDKGSMWAVGTNAAGSAAVVLRWDGSKWHTIPTVSSNTQMSGVAALADNDVWLAGYSTDRDGDERALVMHWDGTELGIEFIVIDDDEQIVGNVGTALHAIAATGDHALAVGWHMTSSPKPVGAPQRPAALVRGSKTEP